MGDELVQAVKMAKMVGLPYRLDWSMVTGVQTLTINRKRQYFLFGRELPAREELRT